MLEWVNNTSAPPVEEQERQQLTGGSSILRNQAICPFAAFAIHRLGAKAPLPAYQGLSPIDRGHILHNSLASFWLEVKTQKQLLALDEEKQAALLRSHVEAAIAPYKKRAPDIMGPRYTELEISRQCHLITQWLNQEKLRPSFSVKDIETTLKVDFHGLPLTLRLDRLDQLDNGQLIVIDYKTGSPNLNQWQGDRPEEPQLPLYAVCYSAEIHALMFVEVNARQVRPIGLGDLTEPHDGITPIAQAKQDLPEDWQQTCEHWNKTLTQLTEDFLQGEALATFKSQQAMRYYTDILPLTRQAEQARLLQLFSASAGQTITELPS
jgi:ATP-dependent helicase/DNAse subunit B